METPEDLPPQDVVPPSSFALAAAEAMMAIPVEERQNARPRAPPEQEGGEGAGAACAPPGAGLREKVNLVSQEPLALPGGVQIAAERFVENEQELVPGGEHEPPPLAGSSGTPTVGVGLPLDSVQELRQEFKTPAADRGDVDIELPGASAAPLCCFDPRDTSPGTAPFLGVFGCGFLLGPRGDEPAQGSDMNPLTIQGASSGDVAEEKARGGRSGGIVGRPV